MDSIITPTDRCLLVAAAPKEFQASASAFISEYRCDGEIVIGQVIKLDDRFDLVLGGVGKAPAAAATARVLTQKSYGSVISVGVAGSLPGDHPLAIGTSMAATRSSFSDEGVGATDGFIPMSELGFAPFAGDQMGIDHDPKLTALLGSLTDTQGIIATVSWCSGDDGCAKGVVSRTGAVAEAMEGAACAVAAQMIDPSIRTGELRVISNTTGNRKEQVWDLDSALAKLANVLGRLG
ncbi:MAG: futalosine hydrolase [Phycisphaerales bacterium]|nr:futalosine hydrolase [Phycisphaerales bacterium]